MESYRILKPRIVYEVLNTEVIAIDFNTGTYYALLHVAKQVWLLIEQQIPFDQIVHLISAYYKRDLSEVTADVRQLIDQLLEKGLIERLEGMQEMAGSLPQIDSLGWGYEPPKLMSYMDIQDLLLIDPIHEVVEIGWPNQ